MHRGLIFTIISICFFIGIIGTYFVYQYSAKYYNYNEISLLYSLFGGILGSVVYMTRKYYQTLAENSEGKSFYEFDRKIYWYIFRPLLGAVTGILAYLIIYISFDLAQSYQNQISIYLLGFLSGYNFSDFMRTKVDKRTEIS